MTEPPRQKRQFEVKALRIQVKVHGVMEEIGFRTGAGVSQDDIERGLVLAFGFFDHDAAVRSYPLPDGTMTPNILTYPQTIEISELFQIRKGKIDQIEAVINSVPYRMKSEVWDE